MVKRNYDRSIWVVDEDPRVNEMMKNVVTAHHSMWIDSVVSLSWVEAARVLGHGSGQQRGSSRECLRGADEP
jgi:hypothetical protein